MESKAKQVVLSFFATKEMSLRQAVIQREEEKKRNVVTLILTLMIFIGSLATFIIYSFSSGADHGFIGLVAGLALYGAIHANKKRRANKQEVSDLNRYIGNLQLLSKSVEGSPVPYDNFMSKISSNQKLFSLKNEERQLLEWILHQDSCEPSDAEESSGDQN